MRCPFGAAVIGAIAVALFVSPARAQNVEEMMKWQAATAIHYDVVAEYAGTTQILKSKPPGFAAAVKDRFEISFDWSPTDMAMMGQATFRNFPATLPAPLPGLVSMGKPCPSPKINGTFDYAEVRAAKSGTPGSNTVALVMARAFPAGAFAYALDGPCDIWQEAQQTTDTSNAGLQVPPGMYFAMPQAVPRNITVGKDGKTMTLVDKANGWTYTYTLRVAR